jgi:uncharacterized protein (DUF1800 family)
MGEADARHLLSRTGFGPTAAEVQTYARLTRYEGVDRLLASVHCHPVTASRLDRNRRAATRRRGTRPTPGAQGLAAAGERTEPTPGGTGDVTPSPLTERMTLFWHNHFV